LTRATGPLREEKEMTMNTAVLHYYRAARAHQAMLAAEGRGSVTTFFDSKRTEVTFGAAYGCHAYAAFLSAKRSIHFRKELSATVKAHKKRSAAARKGWKSRRAGGAR
jgi:hypothetical protein